MEIKQKEKYTGTMYSGVTVSFNREWGGHRFTDEECEALLRGETICITDCVSKKGNTFGVYGRLANGVYNGHPYWAFTKTEWASSSTIPDIWCGHRFTEEEKETLKAGRYVQLDDTISDTNGRRFDCSVRWDTQSEGDCAKYIIPCYDYNGVYANDAGV